MSIYLQVTAWMTAPKFLCHTAVTDSAVFCSWLQGKARSVFASPSPACFGYRTLLGCNHRVTDWSGLERPVMVTQSHGQGHLLPPQPAQSLPWTPQGQPQLLWGLMLVLSSALLSDFTASSRVCVSGDISIFCVVPVVLGLIACVCYKTRGLCSGLCLNDSVP